MYKTGRTILAVLLLTAVIITGQDKPKNLILMIGDGMGPAYVSAAVFGIENEQFSRFSVTGLSVTASADALITDSAAGGTAYAAGEKTNNGMISQSPEGKNLETILEKLEKEDYNTGVISTSSITHATPATFYSHVKSRKMEFDIAHQFLNSGIEFAAGGGQEFFLPETKDGKREDNIDLVDSLKNKGYFYTDEITELEKFSGNEKVLALLGFNSVAQANDRDFTLGQVTSKAIERLNKGDKGFFLMVEGSQIDWAGHGNDQDYAMGELKDFNSALKAALDFAEEDGETLVVVTADHETGGMAIVEGKKDGSDMKMKFTTDHHTPSIVPVFAYGPSAEKFSGLKQNSEIGKLLSDLMK